MVFNIIRVIVFIWLIRVIYKWYQGYRELERRRAYDAGRQSAQKKKTPRLNDDDSGEYIDYEEIK
jgi:hypothetical protein